MKITLNNTKNDNYIGVEAMDSKSASTPYFFYLFLLSTRSELPLDLCAFGLFFLCALSFTSLTVSLL